MNKIGATDGRRFAEAIGRAVREREGDGRKEKRKRRKEEGQ